MLTRDNAHAADVFDALTARDVPVEIVGLSGLIRLPEVAEVVATLHLLNDVTANAALLTLLTGPRWAIGPRDLRLLGRRAAVAGRRRGRARPPRWATSSIGIADGIDPAEIAALGDALDSPGDAPYSPEALRAVRACSRAELRMLRRSVGEPLLDIVRRIIDTSGVDIELASAVSPAAAARRDNLDLFVKAVAEFQAVDGDVSLSALLAYLTAEDDQGNGLDLATPTAADSVKLLTVHRAKGLEWAHVFLVGVCETRFPSNRSRTLWTSSPAVLPAPLRGDARDLPQLAGYDKAALDAYRADTRAHDQEEELRLGYVAFTRAAHRLSVTSYLWSPRTTPYGPSPYQAVVRDQLEAWGEPVETRSGWTSRPRATPTRTTPSTRRGPGPSPGPGREAALRLEAARRGRATADPAAPDDDLDMVEAARVADWDVELDRLVAEARADRDQVVDVPLPTSLSATALVAAARRPRDVRPRAGPADAAAAVAGRPVRHPLPRLGRGAVRPAGPLRPRRAARPGRRRHRLRRRPRRADRDLRARARSPTGRRTPSRRRSRWSSTARWCAAGSTRSTPRTADGFLVVDWKTSRTRRRRRAPARALPAGLGRAGRRAARAGARGVLLRAQRPGRRARRRCPAATELEAS